MLVSIKMSAIGELKECLKRYQRVDNCLREVNTTAYSLREERRCIEDEMAQIVILPEFTAIEKLKLEDDGSIIQISKPGAKKAWSLSKKDLESHLRSYFGPGKDEQFKACLKHIIDEQEDKLVTTDYSFNRIVKQQ